MTIGSVDEALRARTFAKTTGALARWQDKINHSLAPEAILYQKGWSRPAEAAHDLAGLYQYRARIYGLLAEELADIGFDETTPLRPVRLSVAQGLVEPGVGAVATVCWGEIGMTTVWTVRVRRETLPDRFVVDESGRASREHDTWPGARSDALSRGLARYTEMLTPR